MLKIVFALLFFFLNAFAAEDDKKLTGFFSVFMGYNDTDFSRNMEDLTGTNAEEIKQANPFVYLQGSFLYKNLTFFGEGEGLKYGFNFDGEMHSKDGINPIWVKEANFLISSEVSGTRIFGLQTPVTSKMSVNSTTLTANSEGPSGRWQNFLKYPIVTSGTDFSANSASFITNPAMPIQNGFASKYFMVAAEDGVGLQPYEKWGGPMLGLSYVSNRLNGFRFGISYFPDNRTNMLLESKDLTDLKGIDNINYEKDVFLKNIFSTSVNYYNQMGDVELSASVSYEHGQPISETHSKKDLNAISAGFNLAYLGISVGGSYTNYFKSMQIVGAGGTPLQMIGNNAFYDINGNVMEAKNSYVYDIGVGYSIERFSASVSFMKSDYINNIFWAGVFSFETKVTERLANYFQVARYQFSTSRQVPNVEGEKSSGYILTVGMKYFL